MASDNAPVAAAAAPSDSYGILSSIQMVKEMVQKELCQNGMNTTVVTTAAASGRGDGIDDDHHQEPDDGPVDTISQIYQLKQRHYEEMRQYKDQIAEQNENIRRLKLRLEQSQNEARTERNIRETFETTVETHEAHMQIIQTQLEETQKAKSELEDKTKNLLVTFEEQMVSITNERTTSKKLIEELQVQKREADSRTGIEEAGRLRAEARRDELQGKVESLQKLLDDRSSKLEQLQRQRDSQPASTSTASADSSSSGLTWTSALKALDILKKEKEGLKAELGRVKLKNCQKVEELEKANKELQRQLDQSRSTLSKNATDHPSGRGGAAASKKAVSSSNPISQQQKKKNAMQSSDSLAGKKPSFEKAISKASTLVASLQSQVDEMEKSFDGVAEEDGKDKDKTKIGTSVSTDGLVAGGTSNASTKTKQGTAATTITATSTAGGKRPNTVSATSTTTGGVDMGGPKKATKKQKLTTTKK